MDTIDYVRSRHLYEIKAVHLTECPREKVVWFYGAPVTAFHPYETADHLKLSGAYNAAVDLRRLLNDLRHHHGTRFDLADLIEAAERDADRLLDAMQAVVSEVESPCPETWQESLEGDAWNDARQGDVA